MPGLYSRIKNWISLENLTNEDLNDEFNNVISNFIPTKVDDYSATVSQMQSSVDPGEVGTESQATSLAGEIERIRYVLKQVIGGAQWYSNPDISVNDLASFVNGLGQIPANRIVDGKKDANRQPIFLKPSGAAATVTLKASVSEPFSAYINGVLYTFTADIALTGLSLAPSTNNTAAITNADLSLGNNTKTAGEDFVVYSRQVPGATHPAFQERQIELGTIGSNITALNEIYAVYKLTKTTSEYIFGYLFDSNKFTSVYRGYFFDSSDVTIPAIVLDNTGTVTLMKASWIFLKTAGTLDVTYNPPKYSGVAPSSPSTGDYWYDFSTDEWKRYNGSSFVSANAVYIGLCAQDTSNTVCARSADFYKIYSLENTVQFNPDASGSSGALKVGRKRGQRVSVFGNVFTFGENDFVDYTNDKDGSFTDVTTENYVVYVTDQGRFKWSDVFPHYRRGEGLGWVHPSKPWRAVAVVNSSGSSFTGMTLNLSDFKGEYVHWTQFQGSSTLAPVSWSISGTASATATNLSAIKIRGRNRSVRFNLNSDNATSQIVLDKNTATGAVGFTFQWLIKDSMSAATSVYTFASTVADANLPNGTQSVYPPAIVCGGTRAIAERDYSVSLVITGTQSNQVISTADLRLFFQEEGR